MQVLFAKYPSIIDDHRRIKSGMKYNSFIIMIIFLLCWASESSAKNDVYVAVASNFLVVIKKLRLDFQQETGIHLIISSGSTGKLYAQIKNGAPFDLFLAANASEPQRLIDQKKAVPDSLFTYARGQLILWSRDKQVGRLDGEVVLQHHDVIKRIAIANPKIAPFGVAAMEVLNRMGLHSVLKSKIVRGENVSQAFQFVASGNADLGFVALSQVKTTKQWGNYWVVPEDWYTPIVQQAVLLSRAKKKRAAIRFLMYLKSPQIQHRIKHEFGYL